MVNLSNISKKLGFSKKPSKKEKAKAGKKPNKDAKETAKIPKMETEKPMWLETSVKFIAVIEMAGKPKEYIEQTLKEYVETIKKDKNFYVFKTDFAETNQHEGLFSTFVEIELAAKNPQGMVAFCFDYMPSSVDVIEPLNFNFDAYQFSSLLNDMQAKLHNIDMLVKTMRTQTKNLGEALSAAFSKNLMLLLNTGEKTLEELSKATATKPENLNVFLEDLVKKGALSKKGDKYSLAKRK